MYTKELELKNRYQVNDLFKSISIICPTCKTLRGSIAFSEPNTTLRLYCSECTNYIEIYHCFRFKQVCQELLEK